MTHKLLVTPTIERIGKKKFEQDLTPDEVVRGELFLLGFTVTNIGESVFPGGAVKSQSITCGTLVKRARKEIELNAIEPGASITTSPLTTIIKSSGEAWIKLSIEARDKEAVEHYRDRGDKPVEEWDHLIFVVDRHSLITIGLLRDLLKGLKKG